MKICIHRGTHQIGGIATEIATKTTRILIDMGEELSLDADFVSAPLSIPWATDANGYCDGVLFTHYHGDHVGQMMRIRAEIPLYAGALAKEIMELSAKHSHRSNAEISRIQGMQTFSPGESFSIGDIRITPYAIDHSACDSYMFLLEADGKRVLYTGDFRLHGVRSKGMDKILEKLIRKVDVVVTEGTTLSRPSGTVETEWDLQERLRAYLKKYKYVFALCATTNLDRIFAFARAVPRGKYSLCDRYQYQLAETVSTHWKKYSSFYEMPKLTWYREFPMEKYQKLGGLLFVRANRDFEQIVRQIDPSQSIMLYSMWDGYRTKENSKLPDFLALAGTWEPLHTSGHAAAADIRHVIEKVNPEIVIPIHTDAPEQLRRICPNRTVVLLQDGEGLEL